MDENEYRSLYKDYNKQKCVFEKVLLTRAHACKNLIKHNLAEREAAGCLDAAACEQCALLLDSLREKATFALREANLSNLAHGKEIKVQSGGLTGLKKLYAPEDENPSVSDISELVQALVIKFGSLDKIPFSEVMPSIVHFQLRKRRHKK
jgi:hypothetical protein